MSVRRVKSGASPTERSLAWLKTNGYLAAVVERWNPHAKCRQDLFGWADIVALGDGELIGLQVTTAGSNLYARIRKAKALPGYEAWQRAGGKAVFHGWKKPTKLNPAWSLVQKVNP